MASSTTPHRDSHLVHDELSSLPEMAVDCRAASANLRLEQVARAAVSAPPSIRYEDFPSEVGKREIRVSEAAARLAGSLHLHLD